MRNSNLPPHFFFLYCQHFEGVDKFWFEKHVWNRRCTNPSKRITFPTIFFFRKVEVWKKIERKEEFKEFHKKRARNQLKKKWFSFWIKKNKRWMDSTRSSWTKWFRCMEVKCTLPLWFILLLGCVQPQLLVNQLYALTWIIICEMRLELITSTFAVKNCPLSLQSQYTHIWHLEIRKKKIFFSTKRKYEENNFFFLNFFLLFRNENVRGYAILSGCTVVER